MALHVQQPPMNGMWHNRVQKPGEGLLIQGTMCLPLSDSWCMLFSASWSGLEHDKNGVATQ
jgi:hypothetical protein